MKSVRLVGILLMVYIQEKLSKYVNFIDADTVATGIMGIMVCAIVSPYSFFLKGWPDMVY